MPDEATDASDGEMEQRQGGEDDGQEQGLANARARPSAALEASRVKQEPQSGAEKSAVIKKPVRSFVHLQPPSDDTLSFAMDPDLESPSPDRRRVKVDPEVSQKYV